MKTIFTRSTTAIALTVLLSGQAFAAERNKPDNNNAIVGLGSGVLVGTAIAGPIGGMLGGLFGIMIADDVNDEIELTIKKTQIDKQQQQLFALQQRFEEADARATILMATMDRTLEQKLPELESSIQFKTASAQLEQHYKTELDLLATTLRNNPKLSVSLSGYADQRGDSDYNQNLSELRALAVKNYLLEQGVLDTQMLTQSFGESNLVSSGSHSEDNFFDRRVSLKVSDKVDAMTAANQ
ncbi:sortase-associated OmpA-like protein PdsO [Paraglaciecola hydrolytica]|uniref:Flagellar motor protein MotB n=1 Tax=Paraglaciecola hydrolytica TaxID=1799789 RepID=A0A136A384_9ALTE|nr:sortase-associated OmpA-like protein PdsO [Paraglaciecola hydrolytica]KXI29692.1 flagellar motor protein MotB [Paraglaciecola hydrolytica]